MAKEKKTTLSYSEAKQALDKIIRDIQQENISIDVLAEKIKQAQSLVQYCQHRLRNIEGEIEKLISEEE